MTNSHFYTKAITLVLVVSFVIPSSLFFYPKKVVANSSCAATYLASLVKSATVTAPVVTTAATAATAATVAASTAEFVAVDAAALAWTGYPIGWEAGGIILGSIATIDYSNTVILDASLAAQNTALIPANQTAGGSTALTFSECILKTIALQLARAMLHNITGDIIKWVNGGFKGPERSH